MAGYVVETASREVELFVVLAEVHPSGHKRSSVCALAVPTSFVVFEWQLCERKGRGELVASK